MVIKTAIMLFAAGIALMYAFLIVSDCLIKLMERRNLEEPKSGAKNKEKSE